MEAQIVDAKQFQVAAYQPFYAQLVELEQQNTAIVFDYESPKGNKEARSHVYKLRQSKAALEKTRKEEKAESLRIGKAIDSEAKEIEARIEAMIEVHQVKLDEIEAREKSRIEAIKTKLTALKEIHYNATSADYKLHIETLEKVKIDDSWQEFVTDAAKAKDESITKHRELLAEREKTDAEAAELERLRKETEDRAKKDREEAIAKAAAEQAKREAEELAARKEAEAKRAIEAAEAKAKAEREAAERRELQLKLDAENAERRRIEAEQKAKDDAIAAAKKAEEDKQKAIEAERKRIEDEEAAKVAEQKAREANKQHKAKINNEALQALVAGGIDEEVAKQCIRLIAQGAVKNVSINY